MFILITYPFEIKIDCVYFLLEEKSVQNLSNKINFVCISIDFSHQFVILNILFGHKIYIDREQIKEKLSISQHI